MSQFLYIAPSFYFMIKIRKLFVIDFLKFTHHFIKTKIIPQLKF